MLKQGDKAPSFVLPDKDSNPLSLESLKGKKIVLYFYPRDNTPGCSRQAQAFAAANDEIETLGAKVIGVSKDSEKSHINFTEKYSLPFTLLSDKELEAIKAYGVWQEKKMYGKVSMGVVRTTFLIDENGIIEKVWEKVKPDLNAGQVLEYLKGEE